MIFFLAFSFEREGERSRKKIKENGVASRSVRVRVCEFARMRVCMCAVKKIGKKRKEKNHFFPCVQLVVMREKARKLTKHKRRNDATCAPHTLTNQSEKENERGHRLSSNRIEKNERDLCSFALLCWCYCSAVDVA